MPAGLSAAALEIEDVTDFGQAEAEGFGLVDEPQYLDANRRYPASVRPEAGSSPFDS